MRSKYLYRKEEARQHKEQMLCSRNEEPMDNFHSPRKLNTTEDSKYLDPDNSECNFLLVGRPTCHLVLRSAYSAHFDSFDSVDT